ncbi:MAG: DUF2652 domain-containing protein [Flavobacteriales bacterium]|nr:DUF2652 domain-containing protein [Flavobacteriales bacterium]
MSNKALYFIPDISGFTSFVKSVEIGHSQHIIAELLELIIDADKLALSVAEVEGDAVFFYKNGDLPTADEILLQTQETYVRFHNHLKLYQSRRICDCGACTSAASLTLKFVVHQGVPNMITVKGKEKPFGEDVIKVHRLLKNKVTEREYLLYTDKLLDNAELINDHKEWSKVEPGEEEYEGVGKVTYKSIGLAFLKKLIKPPPSLNYKDLTTAPVQTSIDIRGARPNVFELVTNMEQRHKWNKDVREFRYKEGEINRVGSKHVCVIGSNLLEFETVTNDFGRDKYVYGEVTDQIPLIKEGTTYYIVEGDEHQTKLRMEFHYESIPFLGWLAKLFIPGQIKRRQVASLKQIKEIIETEKN